jgi:hypothetical protein
MATVSKFPRHRGNNYNSQRRRSYNYDNYGYHSQVATGYKENTYQGDDRRNSGYRNYGREDSSNRKKNPVKRIKGV